MHSGYCCSMKYYYGRCDCSQERFKKQMQDQLNKMVQSSSSLYGLSQPIKLEEKEMSVVDKIKRLTMDKDDRLLADYEIVDECGNVTEDGQEVLWSILLKTHKAELVAKVRELDEEEKSKKKGKK